MARRLTRKERDERVFQDLPRAWGATEGTFVVADLETTGLNAENDEILEFGAVRVNPGGQVLSEFSALVNVGHDLPPFISSREWLMPVDVITGVKRLREKRLTSVVEPIPPAELEPHEYAEWLRNIRRRIADGEDVRMDLARELNGAPRPAHLLPVVSPTEGTP